jgi:predicted ATPase/DNA-binding XRE family transcriptional regulator
MSVTNSSDFAALLQRYRRRSGFTQEALAERAGLSRAAVSLLERGNIRAPQRATVDMLSAALALAPEEAAEFMMKARRARRPEHAEYEDAPRAFADAVYDGRLPVPLTPLIGREQEQAALLKLLGRKTTRLFTLTGPAGVGKTRLALELAVNVHREWHWKVVFVELIPVREPERVLPAISQALGIRKRDDTPMHETLVRALHDRPIVLVLDNFEQVLPAARPLLELLIACGQVKALVTSRAPLNVRGEQIFPVAPLALPDPTELESLQAVSHVPTVALFLARAAASQHYFTLGTVEEGRLVADICARLDGLPLAIELAAARIRQFGLQQLHERLAQPALLGMLSDGPQDLADHQRTMRSTIAWSYALLGEEERRLFRSLGVFIGGASVEAMGAVTDMANDTLAAALAATVDANLLQCADVAGEQRYVQLVTLQAYARERLGTDGELEEARRRHAAYYLSLVELLLDEEVGQVENITARVEIEYENVRASLGWTWETGAIMRGLRMAGALWRFWDARARFLEGLDWLERFIGRADLPTSPEELRVLAQAWTGVLVMAHRLDRFDRAREAGEMALRLRQEIGNRTEIASAMMNLANTLTELREYERAQALYQECLALRREANNRRGMVFPLMNLGGLYQEMGRSKEALACYEESVALSREAGESDLARGLTWNSIGETYLLLDEPLRAVEVTKPNYLLFKREQSAFFAAICAFTLGRAQWRLGDMEDAHTSLIEAARLFSAVGSALMLVRVRYFQASLALDQGDIAAAQRELNQALADLAGEAHEGEYVWWLVERAGSLACQRGAPEQAARLYGAAIAHRDASPRPIEPAEKEIRARDLSWLRSMLGEPVLTACHAQGWALTPHDAIALVRQELEQFR